MRLRLRSLYETRYTIFMMVYFDTNHNSTSKVLRRTKDPVNNQVPLEKLQYALSLELNK